MDGNKDALTCRIHFISQPERRKSLCELVLLESSDLRHFLVQPHCLTSLRRNIPEGLVMPHLFWGAFFFHRVVQFKRRASVSSDAWRSKNVLLSHVFNGLFKTVTKKPSVLILPRLLLNNYTHDHVPGAGFIFDDILHSHTKLICMPLLFSFKFHSCQAAPNNFST